MNYIYTLEEARRARPETYEMKISGDNTHYSGIRLLLTADQASIQKANLTQEEANNLLTQLIARHIQNTGVILAKNDGGENFSEYDLGKALTPALIEIMKKPIPTVQGKNLEIKLTKVDKE